MNDADPIAAMLADLDEPVAPRAAFADALGNRLRAELGTSAPARPSSPLVGTPRIRRRSRLRVALVSVALLLVIASAATATYVAVAGGGGHLATVVDGRNKGASISGIGADGQVRTIWRCPNKAFCGDVMSVAWAPDGRRIALSLTEFGGRSLYPGLHVIDTVTGHDRKLFGLTRSLTRSTKPKTPERRAQVRGYRALIRTYGCMDPDQLAWSPDGSRIAYACHVVRNRYKSSDIHIVSADGTHARLLRTGTDGAAWPSWAPNGLRIAFSSANAAHESLTTETPQAERFPHAAIYTIALDGSHRQRVVTDAVAPAWSPDGSTIAYRSGCQGEVRLVSPAGRDLTPESAPARCYGIGPKGWPAWSPDGARLAIGTPTGVVILDPDGRHPDRMGKLSAEYGYGALRPIWQPLRGE